MFGPELIRINSLINWLIKTGFFLQRRPQIFENVTLVARRRKHFRVFLAIFLVVQLSPKRSVLVHKNSLASCQRCRHSVERVLSNIVIWLLGHFWVDTPHINTFEGDSDLSKLVVCSPPSWSRRPRLGLCQRKRFSQKWSRLRFRRVHEHPAVAVRNSWRR